MKKSTFRFFGLSIAVLLVMTMVYSCGSSSSSSSSTPAGATVALTLQPSTGTVDAVGLNALITEGVSILSGNVSGTLDPATVKVSLSPSLPFTTSIAYDGSSINIVPTGFLPTQTTFKVTTNFSYTLNNKTYSTTQYNTFTTVASAGIPGAGIGSSFIVLINNVTQPPGISVVLGGALNSLPIAMVVVDGTLPNPNTFIGSMILYGGEAAQAVSPTDIKPSGFTIPLSATYDGSYFKSSGQVTITVSGFSIPLNPFALSGQITAGGSITGGTVYAVVKCNALGQAQSLVSSFCDSQGNLTVVGTFTGSPNTLTASWISPTDTIGNMPGNGSTGVGPTSTTALEITTIAGSPVTTIASYLPYAILAQTDPTTGYLEIAGTGNAVSRSVATPGVGISTVTQEFDLVDPATGSTFTTTSGTTYNAFYMFNLKTVSGTTFTD